MKNLQKFAIKFDQEGAGKNQREAELRYEQMLVKEIKQRNDQEEARERMKAESIKRLNKEIMIENDKMLARKAKEKQDIKMNDEALAKKFYEESLEFKTYKLKLKEEDRIRKAGYHHVLDEHIEHRKHQDVNLQGMAERERAINAAYIRQIMNNPQLYQRVLTKVNLSKPMGASGRNASTR